MIRVSIADDHAVVRRGLVEILNDTPDIEVLDEAAAGDELLLALRRRRPDVAVLDLRMPGPSGLDLIKHLRTEFPEVRILILSANPEDQYAVRVVRAGAHGYLTKESAEADLVRAVHRVAGGKRFLTQGMAEALLDQLDADPEETPHAQLSDREFQVMRLIASGLPVSAIADRLKLSVKTVSTYRTRLLQKMGFENNAEITRYAIERGLDE